MSGSEGGRLARALELDREHLLARFARAARALRQGGDPAAAHDVRVALRRMESSLDLWRPFLARRRRRRAARAMRGLRRSLGPVGEARMIVEALDRRASALAPADRATALAIARHARRRLLRLLERSAARCDRRRVARVPARYARAWPERGRGGAPGGAGLERARERIDRRRALAVAALRAAGERGTDDALHAARLAVKRWRYAGERLAAVSPAADAPTLDWLKAVQQALGEVSDLHALRAHVLRWARRRGTSGERPVPCRGLLAALAAERAASVAEFRRLLALDALSRGPVPARRSRDADPAPGA